MTSQSLPTTQFQDSTVSFVGHDQFNLSQHIHVHPQDHDQGPVSPRAINDSPIRRLSVHFTGRDKEVDFLRNALSEGHHCAVYGMPGVGKSQLVLHYAKFSFDQSQYSYIFWISGTTVDKLNDGLSKILELVCHPDRYRPEQDAKLTAARLWLEEAQDDWLLILDNVERSALDFLWTHLPRKNARGHILFTTRTADVAEALVATGGNQHSTLQLSPLEPDHSANLLLRDAGVNMETVTPSMLSHAGKLVESVGCLPLAVAQAASFMKQTHTPLHEMYELYTGNAKIDVVEWENDLTPYQERSVASTFTKQFDKLQEESADTSNLLKFLSFLDPEDIPVALITEGAKEWLCPQYPLKDVRSQPTNESRIFLEFRSLVTLISSPARLRTALQKLEALSLVEYRSTEQKPSLWMHDLIRFIKNEGVKKEDTYREWLQSSVSLICGAFRHIGDPKSPQQWAKCEEFMPHLRSLNQWRNREYDTNLELTDGNGRIALYLSSRARYSGAESLWKQVLEAYETKLGREHLFTLTSVNNLANVYRSQRRYGEAETLCKRALAGRETRLGPHHSCTLKSVNNLATIYMSQGRYNEAEPLLKRALAGHETHLSPDHPQTLFVVNNLAGIYQSQGRYDEAETLYKQALAGHETYLGSDHPDTLTSVNNLAFVYSSQGRCDEAETLYKRALAGREIHLGSDHPDTLTSVINLAFVYSSQGRYDEAETLYKRALAGRETHLGSDHPDILTSVNNLALVYSSQGRCDEAETLYERAITGLEKSIGAHHPSTRRVTKNLADLYFSQGRGDEAESILQRCSLPT